MLFWFLLGMSVALVGARRTSEREVDCFLLVRAAILIALDQTLVSFLWSPTEPFRLTLVFELLTALALALVLLVPLRRWSDAALAAVAAALALGYPLVVHGLAQARLEALPVALRVLVTYDFNHRPMVTFPLAGWLPLPVLGLIIGRRMRTPRWQESRTWVGMAVVCFAVWLISRLTGYGDYTPRASTDGPLQWFILSNGPPALDFMAFYLGLGSLLMAAFLTRRMRWDAAWAQWLVLLGRVALFLFVVHLGVCFLVARPLLHLLRHADGVRYGLSCLGVLVILTALAGWYRGLKARHPKGVLRYL